MNLPNRDTMLSVLKGAGIAAAGAALTYVAHWVASADFGPETPFVMMAVTILVNAARKWIMQETTPTALSR